MAISHNIKPDRGLTTRMLMTGFFLVVLYAVLIGVLFLVLKSLLLILVIAFGLLFCQYFFSDKIAMFAMHAKGADRADRRAERVCDGPEPEGRRCLRDHGAAAPAGRARG